MKSTSLYLDHAATTPIASEVMNAMLPYFGEEYGNPSSMYHSGRQAHQVMQRSRASTASVLNCASDEIIFTGSGTESDNLALLGVARANKSHGKHILVSSVEHKAIMESSKQLEKEGFVVEYIPVDTFGMVDVKDVISRVTDQTILISIMYANNEIGTIEPIAELGKALKLRRGDSQFPYFHTDACQAAGYLSLDVRELGVDFLTLNGAKIYGPKGVGVLYKRNGIAIEPLLFGGGQETGLRASTENLPLIVGLSEALVRADGKKIKELKRLTKLRDDCIKALIAVIPDIVVNGHPTHRLPNNIHISIPYVEGESMVLMLDQAGIQAATGSACSSHDLQVSHVLTAIDQDTTLMHGSLRFTLGEKTTKEGCDYLLDVLPHIVTQLQAISPLTPRIC